MHIAQPWHCLISTNLRAILNLFLLQVRFFFVFFCPTGRPPIVYPIVPMATDPLALT